jgi:hypothetical protein
VCRNLIEEEEGEKDKEGGTCCPYKSQTAEELATECKSCHSLSHLIFPLSSVPVAQSFTAAIWMEDMSSITIYADKIL